MRTFQEKDLAEVLWLFYDTVRNINSRDYTTEQISARVLGVKEKRVKSTLLAHTTLVATSNRKMAEFADMGETGYLDHLYAHHQHQKRGIVTMLCDLLETETSLPTLPVHASITVRNFFLQRGYRLIYAQQVERQGQLLTNFYMKKEKQGHFFWNRTGCCHISYDIMWVYKGGHTMEERYRQCCGIPMGDTKELYGTEKDGSRPVDYCKYCYERGAFTPDCTMEEMIGFCVPVTVRENPGTSEDKAREMMTQYFPTLKR